LCQNARPRGTGALTETLQNEEKILQKKGEGLEGARQATSGRLVKQLLMGVRGIRQRIVSTSEVWVGRAVDGERGGSRKQKKKKKKTKNRKQTGGYFGERKGMKDTELQRLQSSPGSHFIGHRQAKGKDAFRELCGERHSVAGALSTRDVTEARGAKTWKITRKTVPLRGGTWEPTHRGGTKHFSRRDGRQVGVRTGIKSDDETGVFVATSRIIRAEEPNGKTQ